MIRQTLVNIQELSFQPIQDLGGAFTPGAALESAIASCRFVAMHNLGGQATPYADNVHRLYEAAVTVGSNKRYSEGIPIWSDYDSLPAECVLYEYGFQYQIWSASADLQVDFIAMRAAFDTASGGFERSVEGTDVAILQASEASITHDNNVGRRYYSGCGFGKVALWETGVDDTLPTWFGISIGNEGASATFKGKARWYARIWHASSKYYHPDL